MRDIFHVHTYRCGHAEKVSDEQYICKARDMGANAITFTDHAPFPGDLFKNRMKKEELDEYISTLKDLRIQYKNEIEVKIGLEIEYLPSYQNYYQELFKNRDIDILMIGQHFYEVEPGKYSFEFPELQEQEYKGCLKAVIEGMNTGLFQVVAHPDRAFRRIEKWNSDCANISKQVIDVALTNSVFLEQNLSSQRHKNYYRSEFWDLLTQDNKIIKGFDAHSIKDLDADIIKYSFRKNVR